MAFITAASLTPVDQSRFLSYVLRHNPAAIGAELDESGWISIDALPASCPASGPKGSSPATGPTSTCRRVPPPRRRSAPAAAGPSFSSSTPPPSIGRARSSTAPPTASGSPATSRPHRSTLSSRRARRRVVLVWARDEWAAVPDHTLAPELADTPYTSPSMLPTKTTPPFHHWCRHKAAVPEEGGSGLSGR